jgi:hypothetical protein
MATPTQKRIKLYNAANVAGLRGQAADDWVREQLHPPRKPKQPPVSAANGLFGAQLVLARLDRQKGQVR